MLCALTPLSWLGFAVHKNEHGTVAGKKTTTATVKKTTVTVTGEKIKTGGASDSESDEEHNSGAAYKKTSQGAVVKGERLSAAGMKETKAEGECYPTHVFTPFFVQSQVLPFIHTLSVHVQQGAVAGGRHSQGGLGKSGYP